MNFLKAYIHKHKTTMLFKLGLSYTLLILLVAMFASVFAYVIYERSFNEQLMGFNESMLSEVKTNITGNVFNGIDRVYLNLVSGDEENRLYTNGFSLESMQDYTYVKKLMNTMEDQVVTESDWLTGMYTYFSKSGVLIGTDGFIYNRASRTSTALPDWMNDVIAAGADAYIPTRAFASVQYMGEEDGCLIAREYPVNAQGDSIKGYIIFKISESNFSDLLKQSKVQESDAELMIADGAGNVIASTRDYSYPYVLPHRQLTEKIAGQGVDTGHFECKIDGVGNVVSYAELMRKFGWKLISIHSKSSFYASVGLLRLGTVVICLLAILLGLAFSRRLKKKIYAPMRSIMETVEPYSSGSGNEYAIINEAFSNMLYRQSNLEDMIGQTRPAMRKVLVRNLISGKIADREELSRMAEMCGCTLRGDVYTAIVLKMERDMVDNLDAKGSAEIVRLILNKIESRSDRNTEYIGCDVAREQLVVIACYKNANIDYMISDARKLNDGIYMDHYLSCVAIIGSPVTDVMELPTSFERASDAAKYTIFMSERCVLYADEVLLRDDNPRTMDERILEDLRWYINSFDEEKICETVHKIISDIEKNDYSAAYCNNVLLEIFGLLSAYMKSKNYKSSDVMEKDMISLFNDMNNIHEYKEIIFELVENISRLSQQKNEGQNTQMVEKVKDYISNNLEKELSLTVVAEQVFISAQYLCKIFKEETNINFCDYVTIERMEKAKDLLISTNMNIESVAELVGYKTPHYFTKKFKERFGVTPKNFRMNHRN